MATYHDVVSRTFSEYLLLPNLTTVSCTSDKVNLRTPLTKHRKDADADISLNIPLCSAIMQSVSDHHMAISLARLGGISFIFCSQSIEDQAGMVRAVKNHKAGFVVSDSNLKPDDTVRDAIELTEKTGHSTIAITEDGSAWGKLLGILTDKDYRLNQVTVDEPISRFMTPFKDLVHGHESITLEEANDIIWKHKVNCVPIVSNDQCLRHLVFRKDYEDHKRNLSELVDDEKRLRVGAGVNTWDYEQRVPALVEAGVDVLCVDSSDGYSEWQGETLRFVKRQYGDSVKIGGGNVVSEDGFRYLAGAGADFVKVGIGGGSVCITREQKGIGCGQATAIIQVVEGRDRYYKETGLYIPICSDGGISQDYHIGLALAMGADFIMMGRYFAQFDESPSKIRKIRMNTVKEYWGEGTKRANNWKRYNEGHGRQLLFEEGSDAYVSYAGRMKDNIDSTLAKLRSLMCNCGSTCLQSFHQSARFVLVSETSIREGGVHDVIVKTTEAD